MVLSRDAESSLDRLSPETPTNELQDEQGNVHIPSSGISVSDEMEAAQKDRFVTEVVPVKDLPGVAQLVTTTTVMGSFEPVRYLVALSQPASNATHGVNDIGHAADRETVNSQQVTFAMVDIPPFSTQLATRIKSYLSSCNGMLRLMLVTNRDSIHYDEAPSVYSTRRADLDLWIMAFPGLRIVAYRLDIPRDCRHAVAQVLDGYGPFALDEEQADLVGGNFTFVETGRPLTLAEWEDDTAQDVLAGKTPPDDAVTTSESVELDYTPLAIREREQGKRILAVYTPGFSFGSVSFVFPELGVCCSGFTVPVEDSRFDENEGVGAPGPAIDCRGYLAASKARKRQMESARTLIKAYSDRFHVVLPSRGDPRFLDGDTSERTELLLDIVAQYEKIGEIYEQLGIFSDEDDG
jgi:glyoxylase-like metal-dependent hydrolase (beta-lactamase superfamily II)